MQSEYGFEASTRAYRGRLIKWGVRKYNTRRPDGSMSGDEDGDGGSSLSDTESPSPARPPRAPGHEPLRRQDPTQHYRSGRRGRGRDDGQVTPSYDHTSPGHGNGGGLQPPYLDTSGSVSFFQSGGASHADFSNALLTTQRDRYPLVSRSSPAVPFSVWNAPDHSPFSPSHSQAPSYSDTFYTSGHSPAEFSTFDTGYYETHHTPVSGSGFDPSTFPSFGSLGDGHGGDYGNDHQHYRHQDISGGGSSHYFADYPSSTRQHGQSAGGSSRRGHRDRGRG